MRRRIERGALLAILVLVWGFGIVSASSSAPGVRYRDGVVLVRFASAVPRSERTAALAEVGGLGMGRIGGHANALHVPAGQVEAVVRKLEARNDVVYAEPDYVQSENAVPNDPSFGLQWALRNTGQTVNGKAGVAGADEHAAAAWDVTTGTHSVVVAEVDSGVDYTHPDLAANIWSNPGGIGGCAAGTHGFNVLTSSCDPMDDETTYGGHGTHVAGIIGATGNNNTGVTGVNWTTTILPVKWLDSSGKGATSDLISALDWVLKAKQAGVNIRVVNDSATYVGTSPSQALSDEIDLLGQNDILFVTAAGNTGDNNDDLAKRRYPCGYDRPTEICVTASDQTDHLPSWSNYGSTTVDLAAPGDNVYSTLRNGTYGYISGGSMASPQVAGTAALILSRGYMSVVDLRSDILDNVDPIAAFGGLVRTGGRLDVCKAVPGCTQVIASGTFGQTGVGPSSDPLVSNRKRVNRYQLSVQGTVTKLSAYLQSNTTTGKQLLRGIIYADNNGGPGVLLGVTNELVFHGGNPAGWYDLSFPSPLILQPGSYWIGLLSGSTSKTTAIRWTTVTASHKYNSNTYTSGASDPFGSLSTDSEQLSLYATYTAGSGGSAPVNTAAPTISGVTLQGATLTASTGTWTGSPTSIGYQWQRCDSSGASCSAQTGATASTYVLQAADVGSTIRVVVTAANAFGPGTATSLQTAAVQAPSPGGTLGTTTIGPNNDTLVSNRKYVNRYQLSVQGAVTKLSAYLQSNTTTGKQLLRGVIYADNNGGPGALLGVTNELVFHGGNPAGWYDLSFPSPLILQPGSYWIGLLSGSTSKTTAIRWTTVTASHKYNSNTYTSGASDPFGSLSTDSEQLSLYATFS